MYIDFRIENQKMRRTDNNIIAANSQEALKARFRFDENWNGLLKKAIFEYNNKALRMALENDECIIPYEVLSEGFFDIGIIATSTEKDSAYRLTTNILNIRVVKGPSTEADNAKKPTPLEIDRIEAVAQSVRNDADNGKFNASVSIGNVESVSYDQDASVINVGDSKNAVFDFKIPRGRDGISLYAIGSEKELKEHCLSSFENYGSSELYIVWAGETANIQSSITGDTEMLAGNCYLVTFNKTEEYINFIKIIKKASIVDSVLYALPEWKGGEY